MTSLLRMLIREMSSPLGDSEAEILTDIDEVLAVLSGICDDVGPKTKMELMGLQNHLRAASQGEGRKIAAAVADILNYVESNDEIEADGLILRLEALLRRSLPTPGTYDTPQSGLNPPYDPTKTGRYMTTEKM
jgi:hypothetical protein